MKKLIIALLALSTITASAFAETVVDSAGDTTIVATSTTSEVEEKTEMQPFFYGIMDGERILFKLDNEGGENGEIKITANSEGLAEDQIPFIEEGRTYIPFRAVFETLLKFKDVSKEGEVNPLDISLDLEEGKLEGKFTYGNDAGNAFTIKFKHNHFCPEEKTFSINKSQECVDGYDEVGNIIWTNLSIMLKQDRTYLPVRMLSVLEGVNVGYAEDIKLIYVTNLAKDELQTAIGEVRNNEKLKEILKSKTNIPNGNSVNQDNLGTGGGTYLSYQSAGEDTNKSVVSRNINDNYRTYSDWYYWKDQNGDYYSRLDIDLKKEVNGVSGTDDLIVYVDGDFKLRCVEIKQSKAKAEADYSVDTDDENIKFFDVAFYDGEEVFFVNCETAGDFVGDLYRAELNKVDESYRLENVQSIAGIKGAKQMCVKDDYCWYIDTNDNYTLKRVSIKGGEGMAIRVHSNENITYYSVKHKEDNKDRVVFYDYVENKLLEMFMGDDASSNSKSEEMASYGINEVIAFNVLEDGGYDFCLLAINEDGTRSVYLVKDDLSLEKIELKEELVGKKITRLSVIKEADGKNIIYVKYDGGYDSIKEEGN